MKFNQKRRNAGTGSGLFPLASGYLDAGYYDSGNQGPVIVLQQPESPTMVLPPPPPPQPELHAYSWPESTNDPSALFTIISKDGAVSSAAAVWVQSNTVYYFAPDGAAGSLQLNSINREATRTANRKEPGAVTTGREQQASLAVPTTWSNHIAYRKRVHNRVADLRFTKGFRIVVVAAKGVSRSGIRRRKASSIAC